MATNTVISTEGATRTMADKLNRYLCAGIVLFLASVVSLPRIAYSAPPATPTGLCIAGPNGTCAQDPQVVVQGNKKFNPGFYMRVGRDNNAVFNKIANNPNFVGVQKVYHWRNLEPSFGSYDFSEIIDDLNYAKSLGKRLVVQINDSAWNKTGAPKVPKYMWNDPIYGDSGNGQYYGVFQRKVKMGGWVPIYWNKNIQARTAALYAALGKQFDSEPYFEGIILGETSVGGNGVPGFSASAILAAFKARAVATKTAFPRSNVLHVINFAPFDLTAFADWLVTNQIGLSCPDIIMATTYVPLHTITYPLLLKYRNNVPIGPMVQWDNYERRFVDAVSGQSVVQTSQAMLDFTVKRMDPQYMFWVNREPYFTEDAVPVINAFMANGGQLN